ncbi:hypothetical protein ACRYCC_08935 [Actinomadura scrupuli]|uniref:hypothetical protein n=1 Tax=Actinomadura scrupuli TaxID=559629 RepID=UPI003D984F91
MGTRGRPTREPAWLWWILFAGLTLVSWLGWSWRGPLFVLALWCLYEFVLIPTKCNISPRDGFVCAEPVRGRLFACNPGHQRLKTDQLFRLFRLANPVQRPVAPDPNRATGEIVWAPHMRGRKQAAQNPPPAQPAQSPPPAQGAQPPQGGQPPLIIPPDQGAQPPPGGAQPLPGAAQPVAGTAQPVPGAAQPVPGAQPAAGTQPVPGAQPAAGTQPVAGAQPAAGGRAAPRAPQRVRRILSLEDERMVLLTAVATLLVVIGMAYGLVA